MDLTVTKAHQSLGNSHITDWSLSGVVRYRVDERINVLDGDTTRLRDEVLSRT